MCLLGCKHPKYTLSIFQKEKRRKSYLLISDLNKTYTKRLKTKRTKKNRLLSQKKATLASVLPKLLAFCAIISAFYRQTRNTLGDLCLESHTLYIMAHDLFAAR